MNLAQAEVQTVVTAAGIWLGSILLLISDITSPITFLLALAVIGAARLSNQHDYFRNLVMAAGILAFVHAATQFFDVTVFTVPPFLSSVTVASLAGVLGDVSALFDPAVAIPIEAAAGFMIALAAAFRSPDDAEPRIAYASFPVVFAALLVIFTGNTVFGVSILVLTVFLQQGEVFRYALYAFTVVGLLLDGVEIYSIIQEQALFLPAFIEQGGFLVYQLPVSITSILGYVVLPFGVIFYQRRWRSKEELEEEILEQEAEEAVMWEEETTRDKIRKYVRKNPRAAKLMTVSVLLGVLLISITNFYYFSIQDRYTLTFTEASRQDMQATVNSPFTTEFVVENPGKLETATVSIRFREIDSSTVLDVTVNEEEIDQIEDSFSGARERYVLEQPTLQRVNTLQITLNSEATQSKGGSLAATTTIQQVEVTATTGGQDIAFYTLNFFGLLAFLAPLLYLRYNTYQRKKELEDRFPDFLRDVVSGTRAGMSLTQAIKNTKGHDYGALNPHVDKMAAQIDWGLSFEDIMKRFADDTGSRIIQRAVATVNQSYRSGGNIYKVLEAVSDNIEEVKKLQRERASELYGSMISGYIIYGVFLVVLVILARYLIPNLVFEFEVPGSPGGGISDPAQIFSVFRGLVIVQAVFSGLVIGKLGEGDIKAGAKHVGILLIIGYSVAVILI